MSREEYQENVKELIKNNNRIIIEWGTGLGKTLAAIKAQESIHASHTIIIVSERSHIQNWKDEYIKHNKEYLLENTKIFCYASLKNNIFKDCDLLILDEAHHALSELRVSKLKEIKYKKLIALSATLSKYNKNILNSVFGDFYINKISMNTAIKSNILPAPIYYLIPMDLDNNTSNHTFTLKKGKGKNKIKKECLFKDRNTIYFDKNYPNLELSVQCTEYEYNLLLEQKISYLSNVYLKTRNEYTKNAWLSCGSNRKKFLGECKTLKVKNFINHNLNKDKRFICFNSSIEQSKLVSNNTNIINSKNPSKFNDRLIEIFNNKLINSLYAVGMLTEGQNLTDIDAVILVQLDSNIRTFIQKSGRAFRNKNPKIYIFYYKNTHDEIILKKVLETIDKQHIKFLKL